MTSGYKGSIEHQSPPMWNGGSPRSLHCGPVEPEAPIVWRKSDRDDAAEAAWRSAVEFADSNGCSGGRGFLKRFNANRERYSCDAMRREQQASPSTYS